MAKWSEPVGAPDGSVWLGGAKAAWESLLRAAQELRKWRTFKLDVDVLVFHQSWHAPCFMSSKTVDTAAIGESPISEVLVHVVD